MLPGSVKIPPDAIDFIMSVSRFKATIRIEFVNKIATTGNEPLTQITNFVEHNIRNERVGNQRLPGFIRLVIKS